MLIPERFSRVGVNGNVAVERGDVDGGPVLRQIACMGMCAGENQSVGLDVARAILSARLEADRVTAPVATGRARS